MKFPTMISTALGIGVLWLAPIWAQSQNPAPGTTPSQNLRVSLLGTGGPQPGIDRFGAGILVEAASRKMLFDSGRGVAIRLAQLGMPPGDMNLLFFTHLHSDHVVGFPDLWLTGWLLGRKMPFHVFGPKGTEHMMAHLTQAYAADVQLRLSTAALSQEGGVLLARDIEEGVVYEEGGVKVTAFDVDHGRVKPAFGYRVDYGGRSVVLSGDTGPSENLIRFAQGVDVLIHEVTVSGPREGVSHTSPEDAGAVFTRAKPRLAVYSHIGPLGTPADKYVVATRKTYQGPLEVGEDLMSFEVGDEIRVSRFTR